MKSAVTLPGRQTNATDLAEQSEEAIRTSLDSDYDTGDGDGAKLAWAAARRRSMLSVEWEE